MNEYPKGPYARRIHWKPTLTKAGCATAYRYSVLGADIRVTEFVDEVTCKRCLVAMAPKLRRKRDREPRKPLPPRQEVYIDPNLVAAWVDREMMKALMLRKPSKKAGTDIHHALSYPRRHCQRAELPEVMKYPVLYTKELEKITCASCKKKLGITV